MQQHHKAIIFLNLAIFNVPLFGDEVAEYDAALWYEGCLSLNTGFRYPTLLEQGAGATLSECGV